MGDRLFLTLTAEELLGELGGDRACREERGDRFVGQGLALVLAAAIGQGPRRGVSVAGSTSAPWRPGSSNQFAGFAPISDARSASSVASREPGSICGKVTTADLHAVVLLPRPRQRLDRRALFVDERNPEQVEDERTRLLARAPVAGQILRSGAGSRRVLTSSIGTNVNLPSVSLARTTPVQVPADTPCSSASSAHVWPMTCVAIAARAQPRVPRQAEEQHRL